MLDSLFIRQILNHLILALHRDKNPGGHGIGVDLFPDFLCHVHGFLTELLLGIDKDLPQLIRIFLAYVGLEDVRFYIILQFDFQNMENFFFQHLIFHRKDNLHPLI